MCDPALFFQPDIGLFEHLGDAIVGEHLRREPLRGGFRRHGFGAVFAKLSGFPLTVRIGPGAARAIETILLIYFQQRLKRSVDAHFLDTKCAVS
jgi:hypothetical protein